MHSITKGLLIAFFTLVAGLLAFMTWQFYALINYKLSFKIAKLSNLFSSNATINLNVIINTSSIFEVTVTALNLVVSINGKQVSVIALPSPQKVSNGSVLPFVVQFNPSNVLGTAWSNLLTDYSKIMVNFKGSLSLDAGISLNDLQIDSTQSVAAMMQ